VTESVTPVYKKGDASLVNNYRPILLLANCKIGWLIMFWSFCWSAMLSLHSNLASGLGVLHRRHWFVSLSSGTRTRKLAVATFVYFWTLQTCPIIGLAGTTLTRFCDYLTNRSQYVVLEGFSSPISVTSGVLHGSILGPLLFILN